MNINKINRVRFCQEAESHIENRGGIKKRFDKDSTEYTVSTPIGNLTITVRKEPSSLHFVATNFIGCEDKAKEKFGHWKNNYISSEDYMDTQENILAFKAHLDRLIWI